MPRPPELAGVRVSLVVAMADNGVIGRGGDLPWHLPDDLKHFKAVTLGKPVLMGRRTFESIGRALPGRRNLVMSRAGRLRAASVPGSAPGSAPGSTDAAAEAEYVGSVEEARTLVARGAAGTGDPAELCVIGGAQVYALALPLATRIYLTRVHAAVEGDVYFPSAGGQGFGMFDGWQELERVEHAPDARHAYAMSFVMMERYQRAATAGG